MTTSTPPFQATAEPQSNVRIEPDAHGVRTIERQTICPRCDTQLMINYDEPQCLLCGYVDYSSPPTAPRQSAKNPINGGREYNFRYVGQFPSLVNIIIHAEVERVGNRVVYSVTCPFCHNSMEKSSLSGKRREAREERYKCDLGHRVSLVPLPYKKDDLGWK